MSDPNAPRPPSPLAQPGPWDDVSKGYDEVNRPYLGLFSEVGLAELGLEPEWRFLDVACGPGTTSLLAAPQVREVVGLDFSKDMLAVFGQHVADRNLGNVEIHHGDGQELPFEDDEFDCAVSMFGLMFFPDRRRGMREMRRVLRPGGRALLSSWAPVDMAPAMVCMFDALRAIDPSRPAPQRDVASLENPDVFRAELTEAGFSNVRIDAVEKHFDFETPDEFWDQMVRGAAPMVMMRKNLGEEEWERRSSIAKRHLHQTITGQRRLGCTAYLAYCEKPLRD